MSTATSEGRSEIKPAATLIFTWGNPSRGDDAIGPEIYQQLKKLELENVELQTDFQLQIEHVIDLEDRERILFIDASVSATAPFEFNRIYAEQDDSYTTHAMSPQSLLSVYEKVNKQAAPPAFMLSVRGYAFDLGLPIFDKAALNLDKAMFFIKKQLINNDTKNWQKTIQNLNPENVYF